MFQDPQQFLVTLEIDDEQYSTYMTPSDVEEISSDDNKYKELFYFLKQQAACRPNPGTVKEDEDFEKKKLVDVDKENEREDKEKFLWTRSAIQLLITTRLEMEKDFTNPTCKKTKLWNIISKKMHEIGKFKIPGSDCDSKYRNLLQTYRHNKEKTNKTGEGKITWEYYDLFDEVLGYKASSLPPKNILTSSIRELRKNVEKKNEEKIKKKLKAKKEMSMGEYLAYKKDLEERKWHVKKELKEKEIDAIKLLADAIRNPNMPGPSGLSKTKNDSKKRVRESSDSESD